MALIPFAEHKIIPAGSNDPPIIPIGIILHVDAGNASDLYDFFKNRSGGIESTGHIRKDGHLFQYRDTEREADANLKANSFYGADGKRYGFLSFETQGYGAGEWTTEQMATIKRVLLWGRSRHGIRLRVCPGPFSNGVGYHTLFGAPSPWTPVAKSCPGPDRKRQFHDRLVPWMARAADSSVTPVVHTPNIDAALTAKAQAARVAALKRVLKNARSEKARNAAELWLQAIRDANRASRQKKAAAAALKREQG